MRRILRTLFVTLIVLAAGNSVLAQSDKPASVANPPININTATLNQLQDLPGIGRATAERIIEYRQKSGGFKKLEELMNVKGIGEKSFLKLKPLLVVQAKTDKPGGQR